MTTETGEYHLSAGRLAVERHVRGRDGESFTMYVRVVDDVAYLQMAEWPAPMRGCWFGYRDAEFDRLAAGMGVEGTPTPIAMIAAATHATWAGDDADALTVEVPAVGALQFVGVSARIYTKLRGLDDVLVPATMDLDDGAVAALKIRGADVAKVLEESGAKVDPKLLKAIPGMRGESRPEAHGVPTITAPRADLVVSGAAEGSAATCH